MSLIYHVKTIWQQQAPMVKAEARIPEIGGGRIMSSCLLKLGNKSPDSRSTSLELTTIFPGVILLKGNTAELGSPLSGGSPDPLFAGRLGSGLHYAAVPHVI